MATNASQCKVLEELHAVETLHVSHDNDSQGDADALHHELEREENQHGNNQNEEKHRQRPAYVLPLIVFSQFAGTSLWFAGNAVLPRLVQDWEDEISISEGARGYLTSVVQLGFIVGTLASALLNLPDRFQPTKLFLWMAVTGALLNALIPFWKSLAWLVVLRLGTGICLAGIYPVGMKVAADWYEVGLGRALGWLVGALAVGSSLPFLLNQIHQSWQALLWETSGLAALGGLAVGFVVPDGPYRKPGTRLDPSVVWTVFAEEKFRGAAFGYFGHMLELYAFWTYIPVVWKAYIEDHEDLGWDASSITFMVLAVGGLGCVIGGFLSDKYGSANVAFISLWISGFLCFLSPALYLASPVVMLVAYVLWGLAVVADSPQFSSLVARYAPGTNKGSALTIVNCIGFSITIGSIQLLGVRIPEQFLFLLLAPGPVVGLLSMRHLAFASDEEVAKTLENQEATIEKPEENDNRQVEEHLRLSMQCYPQTTRAAT